MSALAVEPATTRRRGLRIAMVGQRGIPATYGGVERHVEELGARLVDMGHEVVVYCRPNYSTDPLARHRGMELRHLATPETKHLEAIVHSAGATLSALHDGVDIVHYHALGPGLVAPIPRVGSRAKVVQTVHGLDQQRSKWGPLASSILGLGCWMSARVPDATIVVSHALQDYYRRTYGRTTTYICNGVEPRDMHVPAGDTLRRLGLRAGGYVLFVGRLVPEKAPDLLLRAFARLGRDDLRLVIAGGSSFTAEYVWSLRTLARRDQRTMMPGYLHGEPLEELYANAGVFVLPSEVEGMPLTLLEASAHGTPILASDIPPHVEVLGAGGPGRRIFRHGDEDDLLRTMTAMLEQREVELVGAQESRLAVCKEFSWDRAAEQLSRLYVSLVDGEEATPSRDVVVDVSDGNRRRSVSPPRERGPAADCFARVGTVAPVGAAPARVQAAPGRPRARGSGRSAAVTALWEIGRAPIRRTPLARPGRGPALAEVVVVSEAVHGVQDAVRRARPEDLLEPVVLAPPEARRAATAESPILSGFLMTSAWAERLAAGLSPGELRRVRLQAGLAGLVLQVDGLRLELAVRLRQVLHPQRATHELVQIAGVGLTAAEQGQALVAAAAGGCPQQQLAELVQASRQRTDLVRTLNLMLVENLPDERLDG